MTEKNILIIDFGSQYTQLIARRLREIGVYCEVLPHDCDPRELANFSACGTILSGGPDSVTSTQGPTVPQAVFASGKPVLGICYGMQAMAQQLGGHVALAQKREFGHAQLQVHQSSILLNDFLENTPSTETSCSVWMSHGDHVVRLPPGFHGLARTENAPYAAIADTERHFYGLQFHPEVTHTHQGQQILARFAFDICGADNRWQMTTIRKQAINDIKKTVGDAGVLLALSGGVDSSVVAALMHQALGAQLVCVFVDTGLLRIGESEQVMQTMATHMGIRVIRVDAREKFLDALTGVVCPEQKRKIIGQLFIEIFEAQAAALTDITFLAQGTIYSDVIESAGNSQAKGVVIKSHHNVGGLPERMHLKLIEPVRHLFKDEVRKLGIACGLPEHMVYRHPFPGPGLAVRVLGEVKQQYLELLAQADAIFIDALRSWQLYDTVSQAFVVFMPIKSVAVMGDARCYDYVVCLRAVTTEDFMTAHWARLPYEFLAEVSNRIINEVIGISRVTYDISGKPPATIEWE